LFWPRGIKLENSVSGWNLAGLNMNRQRLAMALVALFLGLVASCGGETQTLPTATPIPETKTAPKIEPQSQALMLRLTSPQVNLVTSLGQISVTGVTSPDATLSVNGILTLPDPEGRFSVGLDISGGANPLVIEVVATSITGETESQVRPVIFSAEGGSQGLFGVVTSVSPSEIKLQTGDGSVTFDVDGSTSVSIYGWKSPSVSNITPGALVGVMIDGSRAESVMAVASRPVRTRHFTGIVTTSQSASPGINGSITLLDSSGRQITAIITDQFGPAPVGEVVTAVLEQDITAGTLTATAYDRALSGAERVNEALAMNQGIESPQATKNMTALRWRLAEHGVRNISMLLNSQPYQGWQDAVAAAEEAYAKSFSDHRIGAPSADVTGLVTAIATSLGSSSTKLITVQPASGQPVMVKLSDSTPVALFGERIKSVQLDLASRITVRYAIEGNDANRVTIMAGNTLSRESSAQLAAIAGRGEAQGVLMNVGGADSVVTIMVDRDSGQQVSLQSAGAAVYRNGSPAALDASMEGSNVFARFDPASYRLLELEVVTPSFGEELISGVIHSFIPKVASGNLTIRTPDGRMRSFTHRSDTPIRRDGLRVSIHDVRPGDLVRPNTRVRPSDGAGEIIALSLKTPEPGRVTGIIRGVTPGLGGQVQVTVSNIWLDLISLKVDSATEITRQGRTLGAQDLAVGQKVALASYDPVTLEAGSLALDPPIESGRASSR
jgi:hypothetical protein